MSERFPFYGRPKPPVILQMRPRAFTCVICGELGESLSRNAQTHPGACQTELRRRAQLRANARRGAERAGKRRA